jgi:hypothetical protein
MMKKKRTGVLFTLVILSILTALLAAWAPAAIGLTLSQATTTTRIQFPPGGTSATVQGSLAPNAVNHYVFGALAGQILTLKIATSQGQVVVNLSGADNALLLSDHLSNSTFTGALPSTQDYLIDVQSAGRVTTQYSLTITIPPLKPSLPPSGAQRIQFAPGATSATVQGQLSAGGSQKYVLRLLAHQLLEVNVFPEQGVDLSVRGANGAVLKPTGLPPFRGYVATAQDYYLTVTAEGAAVSYTVQVIVPARISFAPGGTSGTVQGVLAPQTQGHYIVGALNGQTLNVVTHASQGEVVLVIYGVDGDVLISDHAGATSFTGNLPSTEDYLIDVLSVGSQPAVFRMTVTIPPL